MNQILTIWREIGHFIVVALFAPEGFYRSLATLTKQLTALKIPDCRDTPEH